MKKLFTLKLWLLLLALTASLTATADTVYKTLTFSAETNSQGVSSYSKNWYATIDGFQWDIKYFNNNNNDWNYVKCGSQNTASTATIQTNKKIDKAITQVVVTIDAITAEYITSINLKTATANSFSDASIKETISLTATTGAQTVTITQPEENLYYRLDFNCKQGKKNGFVQISKVEYFIAEGGVAVPTFSPEGGTYTEAQTVTISQPDAAMIMYTTDGRDPSYEQEIGELYENPITISSSCTLKAIAVDDDGNESAVASAEYIIKKDISNTPETAYTAAEAIALIDDVESDLTKGVYVKGVVSGIETAYNPDYGNLSFNISDDGSTTGAQFQFFRNQKSATETYTEDPKIQVGETVIGYGTLAKFNSTYEFAAGNYLVSRESPEIHMCNITWSVNGETTTGEQVQGAAITFPEDPMGQDEYEFRGWTASSSVASSGEGIEYLADGATVPEEAEVTYYAVFAKRSGCTHNFADMEGFDSWTNSYSKHTDTFEDGVYVELSNASKQGGTIPDCPVTKGDEVIIKAPEGVNIVTAKLVCKQWDTKSQTITLHTSTDGETFSGTKNTSSNFTLDVDNVGENIVAIKYTFSNASNQIGLSSFEINKQYQDYCLTFRIKQKPTILFRESAISKYLNDEDFTVVATTFPEDLTLSYASSNQNVATVEDGTVHIVGSGTTTITASFAGDEQYKAASASYELTVIQHTPQIVDGEFDFTGLQDYGSGLELTTISTYYVDSLSVWTAVNVTMAAEGRYRWWYNSKGNSLRTYNESGKISAATLTFTVPEGKVISSITFTAEEKINFSANCGVIDGNKWTGCSNEVTLTATGNTTIKNIVVAYGDPINVNITGANFATLYYGEKNLVVPAGVEALTYSHVGEQTIDATVSYVAGDVIPAGEAVVLHSTEDLTESKDYTFVVSATAGEKVAGNILKGTDVETEVAAEEGKWIYRLINGSHGVGFYRSIEGEGTTFTNGAHKAYMEIAYDAGSASQPSLAPLFIGLLPGDGVVTAVEERNVDGKKNGIMYNVLGQPVDASYKGIVIVDGKKFINK